MADFYQMQAEVMAAKNVPKVDYKTYGISKKPPAPPAVAAKTLYMVAAVWKQYPEWSFPKMICQYYVSREQAERAAAGLSSVWFHRTIVEVKLPEIDQEGKETHEKADESRD